MEVALEATAVEALVSMLVVDTTLLRCG
jgi:hypothetical protein